MRQLKVYDRARRPPEWLAHVARGQYAVFFADAVTDLPLDAEGAPFPAEEDFSCFIFDSLSEAQRYAAEQAQRNPRLRGRIFDNEGCARPPLLVVEHPSVARSRETSPRNVKIAVALAVILAVGAAWLLRLDFSRHWALIYPTVLAINLFLAAARIVQWVFSARETQRTQERAAAERLQAEATLGARQNVNRGPEKGG